MSLPISRSRAHGRAGASALRSSQTSFARSSGRKDEGRLADRRHAMVEIQVLEDVRAIAELCEFARAHRFLITCDRCRDPHAPLTAVAWPRRKPTAALAFCKRCYSGFSAMAVDDALPPRAFDRP